MLLLLTAFIEVPSHASRVVLQSSSDVVASSVSERSTLHLTGEALVNESANSTSRPKWSARMSQCSATCGKGKNKVLFAVCMRRGKIIPDRECKEASRPKDTVCEINVGCEWRLAGLPPGNCGWASEVECWERDGKGSLNKEFCNKIIGASDDEFMLRTGLITTGCNGNELKHVCAATIHDEGSSKDAKKKAEQLVASCGSADAIVIATQGNKGTFDKGIGPYVPVANCGGKISASVFVLAHQSRQRMFAPVSGKCITEDRADNGFLTPGMFRSERGSVILEVHSSRGTLAVASSHGPSSAKYRAASLIDAAKHVVGLKPKIVVWGGDFDIQRPLNAEETAALLTVGATHPAESKDGVDQKPEWRATYNPQAVYSMLTSYVEPFAFNTTLALELQKCTGGQLMELGGLRGFCPTNGKAGNAAGSIEAEKKASWLFGKKKERKWLANLACQAPGQEVEYYKSPLDLETKWDGAESQTPSWPDRLIVHNTMRMCSSPATIHAKDGHDIVFSMCELGPVW